MNTILTKKEYELFEIHSLSRGITCITVKSIISKTVYFHNGIYHYKTIIPKGAYGLYIGLNEELPKECNFYPITTSFNKLHKRVDTIRDAINNPDLHLYIDNKEIMPYQLGVRHKTKGMYLGIETDNNGKYHNFINNNEIFKEYIK